MGRFIGILKELKLGYLQVLAVHLHDTGLIFLYQLRFEGAFPVAWRADFNFSVITEQFF